MIFLTILADRSLCEKRYLKLMRSAMIISQRILIIRILPFLNNATISKVDNDEPTKNRR